MQGLLAALIFLAPAVALADPPPRPFPSFESAKRVARDASYSDQRLLLRLCLHADEVQIGDTVDAIDCGYTPRKNKARGRVLE